MTGLDAPSLARRGLPMAALASLLALVPLAGSSAAGTDADGAAGADPVTSSAVIELVPLPATTEVTLPVEAVEAEQAEPAPSLPRETVLGRGSASYYAARFHGRRTASGEMFDNAAMTAAHRTLPFGTLVRVTNPANGKSVVVRITDRGPFTRGRLIDVSRAAAEQLGLVSRGHGTVELALVTE